MSIKPRIFGAFLVGAGLIASAYLFAPKTVPTESIDPAVAVVSVAPERKFIEIGDEDNDGIPDWSENFRQAAPVKVIASETNAAYAPPDTLTGQLAIELLSNTVRAQGSESLGLSQEDILSGTSNNINDAAVDALYSKKELNISPDNSKEALHAYGNKVAEIILTQTIPSETRDDIEIIQHAVETGNEEILAELQPGIEAYINMRNNMLIIEVPSSVATEHLNLLNTFNALRIDMEGMAMAFSDPIYTMVRMQRYYDDAVGLNNALTNLYDALYAGGFRITEDDIASGLIRFEE